MSKTKSSKEQKDFEMQISKNIEEKIDLDNLDEPLKKLEASKNIQNEEIQNLDNEDKDLNLDNEDKEEQIKVNEKSKDEQLGKFKNPKELLKAYNELEKEFTKRSQKIKEFENANTSWLPSDEEWKDTVDKFFTRTPSAKTFAKDIAKELLSNPELKQSKNCLDVALTKVLTQKFKTPEQLMSDGQFLNDYVLCSDTVKKAVIESYLKGLDEGMPPATLQKSGGVNIALKKKPMSIEEAGAMFLKNNK